MLKLSVATMNPSKFSALNVCYFKVSCQCKLFKKNQLDFMTLLYIFVSFDSVQTEEGYRLCENDQFRALVSAKQ